MTAATRKPSDHEARITNLELAMQEIAKIAEAVERHERILKGGDRDGEKGMLERVRNIETAMNSASGWLRALALMFLAQFVAVTFAGVTLFVKALPVLVEATK